MSKRNQLQFGAAPRANLLPPERKAALLHERTMPKLLIALVASGAVALLIASAGAVPVNIAQQRLAEAEAESASLVEGLAQHAEAQLIQRQSAEVSSQIQPLTEQKVLFIDQYDLIRGLLPEGASISNFSGNVSTDQVAADGVCTGGVGSLLLTVLSPSLAASETLLTSLRNLDGYVCVEALEVSAASPEQTSTTVQIVFDDSVRMWNMTEENVS